MTFSFPDQLTMHNASTTLSAGCEAIDAGLREFDLAPLHQADSSAVAVLLGLQRFARQRGVALQFVNVPANVLSFITLYGVGELLQIGTAAPPTPPST